MAMPRDHALGHAPSLNLARYCPAEHVVVSLLGDPLGHVDFALAALPRQLVRTNETRLGLVAGRLPLAVSESLCTRGRPRRRYVVWLLDRIHESLVQER